MRYLAGATHHHSHIPLPPPPPPPCMQGTEVNTTQDELLNLEAAAQTRANKIQLAQADVARRQEELDALASAEASQRVRLRRIPVAGCAGQALRGVGWEGMMPGFPVHVPYRTVHSAAVPAASTASQGGG